MLYGMVVGVDCLVWKGGFLLTHVEQFSLSVLHEQPETAEEWSSKLVHYFPGSRMKIAAADSNNRFLFTTLAGSPFCWVYSDAKHIQHTPAPGPQSQQVSVLLQLEGRCTMHQAQRECSLQAGELIALDMSQRMELAEQQDCVQLFVCLPRMGLASLPLHDGCMRPMSTENPLHRPLFEMVLHFWNHRALLQPGQEAHAVQTLLGLTSMAPVFQTRSRPLHDVRTQRAMAFIEKNLNDPDINAKAVASAQNVSRRYLDQLFHSTGFRVSGWLWERRLQRAAAALQSSHLGETILQIAMAHGFRSAAHFSRKFFQRFGVTPKQWKEMKVSDAEQKGSNSAKGGEPS